jgi:hypothetical protein
MRSSIVGPHFSERLPQIVGTGGVWNSSNTVSCGTASLQFEKKPKKERRELVKISQSTETAKLPLELSRPKFTTECKKRWKMR